MDRLWDSITPGSISFFNQLIMTQDQPHTTVPVDKRQAKPRMRSTAGSISDDPADRLSARDRRLKPKHPHIGETHREVTDTSPAWIHFQNLAKARPCNPEPRPTVATDLKNGQVGQVRSQCAGVHLSTLRARQARLRRQASPMRDNIGLGVRHALKRLI